MTRGPSPFLMPQRQKVAGFDISRHASGRMAEMFVTAAQVEAVLADYENRYEQSTYGAGRFCYQKGALAVATEELGGRKVVISVLLRKQEQWKR